MEIKRKLYKKMLDWKNQCNGSKALFIEGARRVGKSTISKAFGENEYRSYIFIDFNKANKKVKEAFDPKGNFTPKFMKNENSRLCHKNVKQALEELVETIKEAQEKLKKVKDKIDTMDFD